MSSRSLDTQALLLALRQRGVTLGQPLFYRKQTESTNDDGLRALRDNQPAGALFIAEEQTRGRGRRGAAWWSGPGEDLTFSLLLRPRISAELLPCVTLVIGVAVHRALSAGLPDGAPPLRIKWPNDLLAGAHKLVGILVEAASDAPPASTGASEGTNAGLGVCVGIGINVNSQQLPVARASQATSLSRLRGEQLERMPILVEVLHQIERALSQFEERGMSDFSTELTQHDALRGRRVRVGDVEGLGAGIDARGRLLIQSGQRVEAVSSGTVELLD